MTVTKMGVVQFFFLLCALLSQSLVMTGAFSPTPTPTLTSRTTTTTTTTTSVRLGMFKDFLNKGKQALVNSLAGDYDSAVIEKRLDTLIATNPVLLLSFRTCPFCLKAKACLDAKQAKYTVVELDVDPDGKAIRAFMGEKLGQTSVPAIWIRGTFVGGCNDGGGLGGLLPLDASGKLDPLLKAAKAMK